MRPSGSGVIEEGRLLWRPGAERTAAANVTAFLGWLRDARGLRFDSYEALWRWSVADLTAFWTCIWDYYQVQSATPYSAVLEGEEMQGSRWFVGARVNYAEHVLRHERVAAPGAIALYEVAESRALRALSWQELGSRVRILASRLRDMGVQPGDVVAAYLPNVAEAAIAMLACTAIGAVWSSASPEFGARAVVDRFSQIRPKVLLAADGYCYAGREFPRADVVAWIVSAVDSIETVIWVPFLQAGSTVPAGAIPWSGLLDGPDPGAARFRYEPVPHDHPLWVLFSSGTTGLPKAIVHSHVGMTLEHLKMLSLHWNLGPGSCIFFYTTTGWMMWNVVVGSLITGSSAVLYDGSPMHPDARTLWNIAAATGTTFFGASPTFVQLMQKHGLVPREHCPVPSVEGILLGGAPCSADSFEWFYRCVKDDLWLACTSGGTELCSALVGGVPTLPVHAGEMQARMLGLDVAVWNESGEPVIGEVGELVVQQPFPSMPLHFANDAGGIRYQEAYFDHFPGVWRHGDLMMLNDRSGCYIYGRSDSTLNRAGVRIGTAEIYRIVERIPAIADSLIVYCELPDSRFFMPLFVQLVPGAELTDAMRRDIAERLRTEASPRHVPDRIIEVPGIPYTLTGKKMEVPVRRLLMGSPPEKAASRDSLRDPAVVDWYVAFAREAPELSSLPRSPSVPGHLSPRHQVR